ncbi:MAG: SDR family oxidoreductase [Planctomycetes bacterium]|nr:SDR family oxidoreductase [Planctomycetota bacterium]
MSEVPVSIVVGAGGGIGREVAAQLASLGHCLALSGRTAAKLESAALNCADSPGLLLHSASIVDEPSAATLVEAVINRWGRVDHLVHCAAVAPLLPIDRTSGEVLRETFESNVFGAANLLSRVWPHFKAQQGGRVVLVSKAKAHDPLPGFMAYAAAKCAVESLTRSAAKEGARIGVKAWTVVPGATETALLRSNFSERVVPAAKTMSPAVVAQSIVACIRGDRDAQNGQCIALTEP